MNLTLEKVNFSGLSPCILHICFTMDFKITLDFIVYKIRFIFYNICAGYENFNSI